MTISRFWRLAPAVCAMLLTATAGQAQSVEIIASKLPNPRGLAFAPNGDLYVAAAGSGGNENCHIGPTGPRCFGLTGAILRINVRKGDTLETVAKGLPSLAVPVTGGSATGVHDIDFQGQGNAYVAIGYGGHPELRLSELGQAGKSMARLARLVPNGTVRLLTDIGTFENAKNPDGDQPDSNPFSVLALPGRQIVADAGANALFEIRANGDVQTLAVFPEFQAGGTGPSRDAVPTGLAVGPDGAYYVGQLTGGPFAKEIASVYRVPPQGGAPTVFRSGFTNIVDIAFGPDGSLYVVQIANPIPMFGDGQLIRVAPDGTRTRINVPLVAPGGVAIAKDGTIYVTNNSVSATAGQVLRIVP